MSFFSVLRPETNCSKNQSDINNACFVTKCQDGGENENRNRLVIFHVFILFKYVNIRIKRRRRSVYFNFSLYFCNTLDGGS